MTKNGRIVLVALLLGSALTAGWFILRRSEPHPSATLPPRDLTDPRWTYTGPFRNVRPDVAYVGDTACSPCHNDKCQSYHRHAMGRSIVPIAELASRQRYDREAHNPFEAFHSTFLVEREGDRIRHRRQLHDKQGRTLLELDQEVRYAIGSGHRGHSYFTEVDGYLFQTALSWYAQKQIWDVSPGFGPSDQRRPIRGECLFCHSNRVEPVAHTLNRYETPIFRGSTIGCERCHGPGEVHVRERGDHKPLEEDFDSSIVNPKHLPSALREDVCQQCHLEGAARVVRRGRALFDYRPGLPLYEFWAVFVHPPQPSGQSYAVNHVEQMYASRCFQASGGKLGCSTCHDPHESLPPERREAHYRRKCMECHACSLPRAERVKKSKSDSCIECHMPRQPSSDIVHTAVSDHRILRQPSHDREPSRDRKGAVAATARSRSRLGGEVPRLFHEGRLPPTAWNHRRELALAIVKAVQDMNEYRDALPLAVRLLREAVALDPSDREAWHAKGWTLLYLNGDLKEAAAAFEEVLSAWPRDEASLRDAAKTSHRRGEYDKARSYWQRALEVNPWMGVYHFNLALTLSRMNRWDEARRQCQAALDLEPFHAQARALLAVCHHRLGDRRQAEAEFDKVRSLHPPDLVALEKQFLKETRSP